MDYHLAPCCWSFLDRNLCSLTKRQKKKKNDSLVKLQNKVGEFQNHFLIPEGDLGDKEVIEGEGKMRIRL
jgi:hypothetical protein